MSTHFAANSIIKRVLTQPIQLKNIASQYSLGLENISFCNGLFSDKFTSNCIYYYYWKLRVGEVESHFLELGGQKEKIQVQQKCGFIGEGKVGIDFYYKYLIRDNPFRIMEMIAKVVEELIPHFWSLSSDLHEERKFSPDFT